MGTQQTDVGIEGRDVDRVRAIEETVILTLAGDPCSGFSFATWSFPSRRCHSGAAHSLESDAARLSREKRVHLVG